MKVFLILLLFSTAVWAQLPPGVTLDMSNWIPFNLDSYEKMENTALDMSWLLDAPAGQRGFLSVHGDEFVFQDGTKARFWGGNIFGEANFPEKEEAEYLADVIARSGANIVRMHHLDVVAPWTDKVVQRSFFGGQQPYTTREIDEDMLDKFDYMVKCLKDRGIYIFFSHLSSRFVRPGDAFPGDEAGFEDVAQGFKVEGMFDPFLIELQKEYLRDVLTHVNPYTGKALVDEPALVLTEIINENSLFWLQKDGWFGIESEYYQNMLGQMFRDWLMEHYVDADAVVEAWQQEGRIALFQDEDFAEGTLKFPSVYAGDEEWPVSDQRKRDTYHFLYDVQDDYYQEIYSFLRDIGVKIPIAGSNHWSQDVADLRVNAELDYMDRHSYWTHPENEYNYIAGQGVQNRAMVKDPTGGNIGSNASRRVYGLPYTCSEWHNPLPNPYRAEGTPIMAAFSCLHDWHPMHYAYWGAREAKPDTINSFEVMFDPTQMNLIPISALMFHRQDFRQAETGYFEIITPAQQMKLAARGPRHVETALVGKYGVAFTDLEVPAENDATLLQAALQADGDYRSATNQIFWDTNIGLVKLDAPRTQGVIGFAGEQTIETADFKFALDTEFAVVIASSLTEAPLAESDRILVSTSGDARFSGIEMADDFSKIEKTGHFPFLMQPIEGQLVIKAGGDLEVYALDEAGQRLKKIDLEESGEGKVLKLSTAHRAMHYEILR